MSEGTFSDVVVHKALIPDSNNEGSDQYVHPFSLIRAFCVHQSILQ